MPFTPGYTISDETSLADDEIVWPSGKRCAVSVTVALSTASSPEGISARDIAGDDAELGFGSGLDVLLEVLERLGIRATFAVPAVIAAIEADRVRQLAEAGHEIAALGFRHEDPTDLPLEVERARLLATIWAIREATGTAPAGWYGLPRQTDRYAAGTISPNTVDLLIDEGFQYLGNGMADDIPHYWVADPSPPKALLAMPYSYHFDDQFFLQFPPFASGAGSGIEHPEVLSSNWRSAFAAQHDRGRIFTMTLHPHLIGCLHRITLLDAFLTDVKAKGDVWFATAAQCAEHWRTQHPPETHLRLSPSIWTRYPDDLD